MPLRHIANTCADQGLVEKDWGDLQRFSVDAVDLKDVVGPHHVHPKGEIGLVIPQEGKALFDDHSANWVY